MRDGLFAARIPAAIAGTERFRDDTPDNVEKGCAAWPGTSTSAATPAAMAPPSASTKSAKSPV
ncbi:hypothetical protein [Nocardia rhamnosiphila]|uniref:hypothetical protein n=1 Tax=Nocardia rhamnosiphila TaxID=426716 RepID=UPI0007A38A3E|nr:hypothetical protein [Nocardia rhamnosiphila]